MARNAIPRYRLLISERSVIVNKIDKFELNLYKQNLNNSPPINLEQKFLKEYKDMGFSLYQANDQLTEWKEVKLNQNNEVQKNPCN